MADEQTQQIANEPAETTATQDVSAMLQDYAFGEPKAQPAEITAEPKLEATATTEAVEETETFDESDYLKGLGFDSKEALSNELTTLRNKKPFEWKNDRSKQIAELLNEDVDKGEDELYNFLSTKKTLQKLSTADLSNKNIAAELVKFGIQRQNPNLSNDDVDFLFDQQYSSPDKPIQGDLEEDDAYDNRIKIWEAQVSNIDRKMIIEAKIQQPKLAQLNSELVLPHIQRENQQQQQQPSQEDLQARQQLRDNLLLSAKQELDKFNGFGVQVKDKDVNYNVSYNPSTEEKTVVSDAFQRFTDSDFNANAIFANRWLNADGKSFNTNQIKEDLLRIYCGNKIDQKLAIDSAGKRMDEYFKGKKQISIVEASKDSTFMPSNKGNQMEQLREAAFS